MFQVGFGRLAARVDMADGVLALNDLHGVLVDREIQDSAIHVWESLAILEYLAEKFPQAKLWPQDPAARALASPNRSWVLYASVSVPLRLLPASTKLMLMLEPKAMSLRSRKSPAVKPAIVPLKFAEASRMSAAPPA